MVNNLHQLKSVLLDNCGGTLNVSLIDEKNQYDKQKLNFLMSIDKTSIELIKQKFNTINLHIPYEKIPYAILLQLSKFCNGL